MDLVLEAERALDVYCPNVHSISHEDCDCPTDDVLRRIIAAVYDSIASEGWREGVRSGERDTNPFA